MQRSGAWSSLYCKCLLNSPWLGVSGYWPTQLPPSFQEEEEVGNLQLAWEMLEVAKVIYKRYGMIWLNVYEHLRLHG